jgi:hypothetical protein
MIKNSALMLLPLAFSLGCSDFWETHQIIENVDGGSVDSPDLAPAPLCPEGKAYYTEADNSIYVACCSGPVASQNASNIQTTFRDSQTATLASSVPVTIKFSCAGASIGFSTPDPTQATKTIFATIARTTLVEGQGTTLNAFGKGRFFVVKPGTELELRSLRLTGGKAVDFPQSFDAQLAVGITNAALGGSILSAGTVTLDRVAITDSLAGSNVRSHGGAIYIVGGPLTVRNSILTKNRTADEQGNALAANVPSGGAAITAVNSNVNISYSTIILNENASMNTGSAKGVVEIFNNRGATGSTVSIEKNILVNYMVSQKSVNFNPIANYSVAVQCDGMAVLNGSIAVTNVMDKYKDLMGSCIKIQLPNLPNPGALTSQPAFHDPLLKPRPAAITTTQAMDDSFVSAASLKSNGELDYFGQARPVQALCMPGAVLP